MNTFLRQTLVAASLGGFVGSAAAADFHIRNGASDWCVASSYDESAVPSSSDDVVFIGEGTNVTLNASDTASWQKVHAIGRIVPLGSNSVLTVNVASGNTAEFAKCFTAYNYVTYNADVQKYGQLVKTGAGELKLSGYHQAAGNAQVDYKTTLDVKAGTLTFVPQSAFGQWIYVGRIVVAAGATLNVPYATAENYAVFTAYGYNGEGTIANPGGTSRNVYLRTAANSYAPGVFSGKVTGYFTRGVLDDGYQSFLGSTSDATGAFELQTSYLGVETIGASKAASSLGAVDTLGFSEAGILEYLGDGTPEDPHVAGKGIKFGLSEGAKATLRAGKGGVKFTGAWTASNANKPHQQIVLDGTNTVTPAIVACTLPEPWTGTAGASRNMTLEKKGTGIWRLTGIKGRANAGLTAIREGTLQIDDAEEAGRLCAMGLATNLLDLATGAKVTHAVELGSTEADPVADAVLEYTGAKGAAISTRPIGLVGNGGHVRNNTASSVIRWAGISVVESDATPVLTLDGTSVKTNEVADLTDGAGTLSVCKDGAGTWRLSGDVAFSGTLAVKQGKLLVRQVQPSNYDWYRWTIRGSKNGTKDTINFYFEELGLFDASGYRQNLSPTVLDTSYADLAPGQAAWGTTRNVYLRNGDDSMKNFFDASSTATGRFEPLAPGYETSSPSYTSWYGPYSGQPETALSIVQRLAAGKDPASSWDYMPVWGSSSAADRMTLEGSVDGLHWETLDTTDPETTTLYIADADNSQKWAFSGISHKENSGTAYKPYTSGRTISKQASTKTYSVFPSAASPTVSVAPGATLEAETSGIVLSKLSVTTAGLGAIKGFDLAASGTIDVVSATKPEPGFIPFNFTETETAGNLADWTVTLNGEAPRKVKLTPMANGIRVSKRGFAVIIR